MKRIFISFLAMLAFVLTAQADDKPIAADQLPAAAKKFVEQYYPNEKISFASKDDDFIRPDYQVILSNSSKIEFTHAGEMKSVESFQGAIPNGIIPSAIINYIKTQFPDTFCREFEIGRRDYEVKLSNNLELKFDKNFNLLEIDN